MRDIRLLVLMSALSMLAIGCSDETAVEPTVPERVSAGASEKALDVYAIDGDIGQFQTPLFTDNAAAVGHVGVDVVDDGDTEILYVTYVTMDGWELIAAHTWTGQTLTKMPQSRKGGPVVEQFPYKSGDLPGFTSYTTGIDLAEFGGEPGLCDVSLYVVAQAVVGIDDDGDGTYDRTETAWANEGRAEEQGNWATFFSVQFTCAGVPIGVESETAFAYGCDAAICFMDIQDDDGTYFERWGWSNGLLSEGIHFFDIYAGAGQCSVENGTRVGRLVVEYWGGEAVATYEMCGNYILGETHLYIGEEPLARNEDGYYTVSPGQYPYNHDELSETNKDVYEIGGLTGDIYVVAHAVVWGDFDIDGDCGEGGCVPSVPEEFVFVEPGTFLMGTPSDEVGRDGDETQHQVTLTRPVYFSKYEVTQEMWDRVMETGTSTSRVAKVSISWDAAVEFCNALSRIDGLEPAYTIHGPGGDAEWDQNADGYRLPTEAEWEYACRAGTTTALYNGTLSVADCDDDNLDAVAWCSCNAGGHPHEVGQKLPNAWGIYDMLGNGFEWCFDNSFYQYETLPSVDPVYDYGSGPNRVLRGGAYGREARLCRSGSRDGYYPDAVSTNCGLRIVRNADYWH